MADDTPQDQTVTPQTQSDRVVIENEKSLVKKLTHCTDSDIEFSEVGWTSRVYIVVKGKFVFKFPRTEKVKKEYKQEVKILKLLENLKNSVQVPKIVWVGGNFDYLGYEGIVGQTFDMVIDKLNTVEKADLGQQIGKFLIQLHALRLSDASVFSIQNEISQFQNSYQTVLPTINSHFTNNEQLKLKTLILEEMPTIISKLGSDPALCHGDLGYWNLILSNNNKVGVIDWGDIGYYDKSKDFLGMEDNELLDSALSVYGDNDILRQKIAIRRKVLPMLDLTYFVENNNEQKITTTLKKIQAIL